MTKEITLAEHKIEVSYGTKAVRVLDDLNRPSVHTVDKKGQAGQFDYKVNGMGSQTVQVFTELISSKGGVKVALLNSVLSDLIFAMQETHYAHDQIGEWLDKTEPKALKVIAKTIYDELNSDDDVIFFG